MGKAYNNLIPFSQMPPERHRELSVRGGKASGVARRAKRQRIEDAKVLEKAREETWQDTITLLHQIGEIVRQERTELQHELMK